MIKLPILYALIVLFWACQKQVPSSQITDPVAERMLVYQRDNGGWPHPNGDPIDYEIELSPAEKEKIESEKHFEDTTIDDDATTREIRYLVEAYSNTKNHHYLHAAKKGILYLINAQNSAGGWGQFFPDTSSYRKHITFNDNSMIHVLEVLKKVSEGKESYEVLQKEFSYPARLAVEKGIQCILKCQYKQGNTLTVWCAQHDRNTLQPASARTFELASLSGSESVQILKFLMELETPSEDIKKSIQSGVAWFEKVKILDREVETLYDENGKAIDRRLKFSPGKILWGRFYDLQTNQPFVVGRDGIKKEKLEEIELERRLGYSYFGTYAEKLLKTDYPAWRQKWL